MAGSSPGFRSLTGNSTHRRNIRSIQRQTHSSGGVTETVRYDGQVGEVTSNSTRPLSAMPALSTKRCLLIRAWWSGIRTMPPSIPLVANILSVTDRNGVSTNRFPACTYNVDVQHAFTPWFDESPALWRELPAQFAFQSGSRSISVAKTG